MTTEQLCTNQKLSRKLVEAGIVIDTCFYWVGDGKWDKKYNIMPKPLIFTDIDITPAATASELFEVLPPHFTVYKTDWNSYVGYNNSNVIKTDLKVEEDKLQDMLARAILYLKTNNLLEVEENV